MKKSATKSESKAWPIQFVWLELTRKCNLECIHCYADCGPSVAHGSISVSKWMELIDEVSDMGVQHVQFIGGEPTLFPGFPDLVKKAVSRGLGVEVFTNLIELPDSLLELFKTYGVLLATSFYSDDPQEHDEITRVQKSHLLTLSNIKRIVSSDIPLRSSVVKIKDTQRTQEACQQLSEIGVHYVTIDCVRGVGRGRQGKDESVQELCSACSGAHLAITSSGSVIPCVFARWLDAGNIIDSSLSQVLSTGRLKDIKLELKKVLSKPVNSKSQCNPVCTGPFPCNPYLKFARGVPKDQCTPVCTGPFPCNPYLSCSPKPCTHTKITST
jgi:MoaA/NifB/PqqE/SkfB family radical SAM enzyme